MAGGSEPDGEDRFGGEHVEEYAGDDDGGVGRGLSGRRFELTVDVPGATDEKKVGSPQD